MNAFSILNWDFSVIRETFNFRDSDSNFLKKYLENYRLRFFWSNQPDLPNNLNKNHSRKIPATRKL